MSDKLNKSIHVWAEEFYKWIRINDLMDDDWEFGFYDHSLLSILIAYWIEGCGKENGVNSSFFSNGCCDYTDKELREAEIKKSMVFKKIVDGFKEMATGNESKFDKTLRLFKKYYLIMWS
jgi:hypothetical protein